MKNYYELLGVEKDASQKEILIAASKLAKKPMDEETSKMFAIAFETLYNIEKRAEYDKLLLTELEIANDEVEEETKAEQETDVEQEADIDEVVNTLSEKEKNKRLKIRYNQAKLAAYILGGIVLVGGVTLLVKNHSKNNETLPVEPSETIEVMDEDKIEVKNDSLLIEREKLTAENFSAKVDEIMKNNEEKGLTTTRNVVETALLLSNLEEFSDEDLNKLMDVENVNMQDKLNELLSYVSMVENFNLNNYQNLDKHIALADLSYNQFDYNVLKELDTTYLDVMDVLQLDIVENEDELNAKYEEIREKLDIKDDNEEDLIIKPTENAYITETLTYVEKFIVGDGNLKLADGKGYAKQNISNYGTKILVESYAQVIGDMIREKQETFIPEYQMLIDTINANTNGLEAINGIYGYTLPTPACQKTLTK